MIKGSALLSVCGNYRYTLGRHFDEQPPGVKRVVFIMLNPSTADADDNDPTITRCMGYAQSWGCSDLIVVNLFPLRATDPKELRTHPQPEGVPFPEPLPESPAGTMLEYANYDFIQRACRSAWRVICAWGTHSMARRQYETIAANIKLPTLYCLERAKNGAPKHPLYLKKDLQPIPWKGYE